MKKALILILLITLFSCDDGSEYRQRCDIISPQPIELANPQYINLTVPGGWAYSNGGPQGLIIYHYSNQNFKAFSRECPESRCNKPLDVKNDIKLVCSCDDSEYSILDGSPQSEGISTSVCEFKVSKISANVLNVTNY